MKLKTFLFIVLLTFTSNLFAQKSAFKDLDIYLDHLYENRKMMGSVSVFFKDSLLYSKSIGYANVDTQVLNNDQTKFRVGSITKTYTAVLVLKAIEENKLQLSDKLSNFYPEVKNAKSITIEHLLRHRSGIFNYTDKEGQSKWEENYHTEKEFIDYFVNEDSVFEPGTNFEYSNTNYALLGFILERIYHKPFVDILTEKITKPLNLVNTYFTNEIDVNKNEALSYNIQNVYKKNATINYVNDPASGGIASTANELNVFLTALFNGKIISQESLNLMLPKTKGAYGFGIQKLDLANEIYEHSGRVENFISDYWYLSTDQLSVVVLSNATNVNISEVVLELIRFTYGNKPKLPNFNAIKDMDEVDFLKIKGTYKKENNETVTISSNGNQLMFQSSEIGQMFVPFTFKGGNTFEYEEDIKLIFYPEKQQLYFEQNGAKEYYKKL